MQSVCSPVGFMVGRFDYRAPLLIGEPIPALGRLFCCALLLGREKTYKIIPSSATETERLIEMQIRAMHMDARGRTILGEFRELETRPPVIARANEFR